ncbi:MAG: tetratricopeptide repeat protein, partial [Polyangiaceae bacterium]
MRRLALAFAPIMLVAPLASMACGGGSAPVAKAPVAASTALPPANPQAVGKMVQGVQAAKDGSRDRAIALLREAIGLDHALWEAHYDLGNVLAGAGDLAGAEDELRTASKLAPDAEEVAIALGELRRRRGENKEAADALGDFLQEHPNAIDARILEVTALRDSGQFDAALKQAQEVLVRKPGDAGALAELALTYLAKGERDTASLVAKQSLDANAKSATAERATGLIALAAGDDAAAFAAFSKAAQFDPQDTTARLNMGAVLLRAGAYGKAEDQYRAILQVAADDSSAQVGLAAALRGESDAQHPKKLEEARALLEKVLERDPHNVAALYNLGILHGDFLKHPGDAKPYFQRFLDDAPSGHPSRAEAERHISQANAAAPPPPPAPATPASTTTPPAPA